MRWHPDRSPRPHKAAAPVLELGPLRRRVRAAWDRADALAAEGRVAEARALLERAHRLAASDQNLALALALLRLSDGDAHGAAALFGRVAKRHDVREAWTGLATASLLAGDAATALHACGNALRSHVPDAALIAAASAALRAAGAAPPGWCGLTEAGEVLASLPVDRLDIGLDGRRTGTRQGRLPDGWHSAQRLDVQQAGAALLGSPVDVQAIWRVEGFVARTEDGISGWAWHPAAPNTDPPLLVLDPDGRELAALVARDLDAESDGDTPCARPRGFALRIDRPGAVRVVGRDGRDLAGSPAAPWPAPHPAVRPTPKAAAAAGGPADVVVPVYRGAAATLGCLESVLATVPPATRIWVVDDGVPERDLADALRSMAEAGRFRLIGSGPAGSAPRNRGFPAAANAGLRAAAGRDVVLLNSDTLVAPGWLMRLQAAAHSASDIGTATPVSNEASILSLPDPAGGNPPLHATGTAQMAALAARANAGRLVDIPTAHGFCMFIRADCLAETGLLRENVFAQGYGEENDFCMRALALGWRHVAVPSVYVTHLGGVSFGASRRHLLQRNQELLERLHPGYRARVAAHIQADPLFWARRRLDAAIWRRSAARLAQPGDQQHRGAVLLVSHDHGGGTARLVEARIAALLASGFRPLLLIGRDGDCVLRDPASDLAAPNLRFALPGEFAAMRRLLAAWRPVAIEVHHWLGHHQDLPDLLPRFGLPMDVWIHDYAWLCARITLTDGDGRYCGEPPARACEACVAQWGRADEQTLAPAAARERWAAFLASVRTVIVPSGDVAARLRRHVAKVAPEVRPWEPAGAEVTTRLRQHAGTLRIAVIGAIGQQKGFPVILACAMDAAARELNLSFTIVGYSIDDDALEATGRVSITGPFEAAEATRLIQDQQAALAFIPSTWPETWCFALSDAWAAGLPACVFDIGTQAQRVRESGHGWVLPLGLPAARVNDSLLALCQSSTRTLPHIGMPGTIRPPAKPAR